jgi:hypothetical protein
MRESKLSKSRDLGGFLIPLSVDSSSRTQRMHMYETVQAYCTTHSLRLVALIASTPGSYDHPASSRQGLSHNLFVQSRLYDKKPSLDLLGDNVNEAVARELTEPVLLVRDYLKMLQLAKGRVLVISGCSVPCESAFHPLSRSCHSDLQLDLDLPRHLMVLESRSLKPSEMNLHSMVFQSRISSAPPCRQAPKNSTGMIDHSI